MKVYRYFTGKDDVHFCARVTQALNEGYTDKNGHTKTFKSMKPKAVKIELLERNDPQYHNFEEDFYG